MFVDYKRNNGCWYYSQKVGSNPFIKATDTFVPKKKLWKSITRFIRN